MKQILLILVIAFTSCKLEQHPETTVNNLGLDSDLYQLLIDYQRKNPVPKNVAYDKSMPPPVETSFIYIYEAKFIRDKNATFLAITLYPTGISTFYDKNNTEVQVNGIYRDNILNATYINDPFRLGSNFVKNYISDESEMKNYVYPSGIIMDSMFDIFVYKVSNDKLIFHEVIHGNVR